MTMPLLSVGTMDEIHACDTDQEDKRFGEGRGKGRAGEEKPRKEKGKRVRIVCAVSSSYNKTARTHDRTNETKRSDFPDALSHPPNSDMAPLYNVFRCRFKGVYHISVLCTSAGMNGISVGRNGAEHSCMSATSHVSRMGHRTAYAKTQWQCPSTRGNRMHPKFLST